jgi:hypothetical protein
MDVIRQTVYRLTVVNDCGCKSVREYQDTLYREPLGDCSFSPCNTHSSKSGDVQEILSMMTNQMLNREAENTIPPPAVMRAPVPRPNGTTTEGAGARGGVTITPGASVMVATGGASQTIRVPHMPKRKAASEILNPKSPARRSASGGATSTKDLMPVQDTVELQIEEVPEDEMITSYLNEGGLLGSLEDDPDKA